VKSNKNEFKDVRVGTGYLMGLFSVSRQTISNWIDQGLPKVSRGKFSLRVSVAWVMERDRKRVDERLAAMGYEEQDARLKSAQAGLRELELARQREQVMLVDEHRRLMSEMVISAKSHLRSLPSKMAPQIAHQDAIFIQQELQQEINDILTGLSRRGADTDKPGPADRDRAVGVQSLGPAAGPDGKSVGRRVPVHSARRKSHRARKVAHKQS
jgi:phage terminase Nu1 subunit (DNA packaging protein)